MNECIGLPGMPQEYRGTKHGSLKEVVVFLEQIIMLLLGLEMTRKAKKEEEDSKLRKMVGQSSGE